MKRFCLFVVSLNFILLFLGPKADADVKALAVVPNPVAGAKVLPNKHRHVTVTKDGNGVTTDIKESGIYLVVNAGVVADGYGQVAMLTSGELKQAGKTDAVATLSEGQTIEAIGWNFGLFRINELQVVYCSAIGEYIASTKAQTGDFTLEGESIYASTSSRSKITVSSGAFSIESGSGSSTMKTRNPMKDDYEFSIDYKEEKPKPKAKKPVWNDIPDPYNLKVGEPFYLYLNGYVTGTYVGGDPTVVSRIAGQLPAGLSFNSGVLSGKVTKVESRSLQFKATNSAGSAKSEWIEINVSDPTGYSDNGMYFSAYDEYKAEIFDIRPIKEVNWYIKKPGGKWEGLKRDAVNGANSSSVSYSIDSKSKTGEYKIYAVVFLKDSRSRITYNSSFTVGN